MCEKMIALLARKIYDYMLGLAYVKKTPSAQFIFLCKPGIISPATTCQQTKEKTNDFVGI